MPAAQARSLARGFQGFGHAVQGYLDAVEFALGGFVPLQQPSRTLLQVVADPAQSLASALAQEQPSQPAKTQQGQGYIDFSHVAFAWRGFGRAFSLLLTSNWTPDARAEFLKSYQKTMA